MKGHGGSGPRPGSDTGGPAGVRALKFRRVRVFPDCTTRNRACPAAGAAAGPAARRALAGTYALAAAADTQAAMPRFGGPPQAVDSDKVRAGRLDPRQLEFPVQTVYGATLDFVAKEDIREHPQACGLFRVTVNTRADAPTVTCRGDRDLYRAARRIGAGDADLNLGCGYDGGAGRVGGHDRREAELPERGPLRGRAKA